MSYEEKLAEAKEVVGEEKWDEFLKNLQIAGGKNEKALELASWEDLNEMGLPKLIAKQVADIFRKKEAAKKPSVISPVRAQGMNPSELLAVFDPRDAKNAVGSRLAALSDGQPCIVFNDDRSVNIEESAKIISEIMDGHSGRESVVLDGRAHRVYPVGKMPGNIVDENPLYPKRALRPDGTCDQTGRSWQGVSQEVRLMARLAIQTGEFRLNGVNDAHNLLDLCLREDAAKTLHMRFTAASLAYAALLEKNELPSLKMELNANGNGNSGANNPWGNRSF